VQVGFLLPDQHRNLIAATIAFAAHVQGLVDVGDEVSNKTQGEAALMVAE
jgi:hypothetical protein